MELPEFHIGQNFLSPQFHVYQAKSLTGRAQWVMAVTVIGGLEMLSPPGATPECTVGFVLQPNDVCCLKVRNFGIRG